MKDFPKVATWRPERESNPRPFGRNSTNLPMSHHAPLAHIFISLAAYSVGKVLPNEASEVSLTQLAGVKTHFRNYRTETYLMSWIMDRWRFGVFMQVQLGLQFILSALKTTLFDRGWVRF